jgi:hypothetical protein
VQQHLRAGGCGLYCWDAVQAYEKGKASFIMVARKTPRLLEELEKADGWPSRKTDADEQCEFRYQPEGWGKAYRFIALRYLKKDETRSEQYQLFASAKYIYRVFVTDRKEAIDLSFDLWMRRTHPNLPWCRYADDGLVHCWTEQEAEALKAELQARLADCHLEMHPTKTKVVYCKDGKRQGQYPNVKFDFLGFSFRPRLVRNSRDKSLFCGFNPAVSPSAMKAMRQAIRDLNLRRQTQLTLQDIARQLNPLLRGWIGYYGRYARTALAPLLRYINQTLVAWVRRKFKRFNRSKILASKFLQRLAKERADLFAHWQIELTGVFA